MPEGNGEEVIVLGAGIVGICSALALQDKGFKVTLIDRAPPAEGASRGNAGAISPWSCVPQSMPGIWKNVPKWLLDPEGPLAVRWTYSHRVLPWILRFLRSGSMDRLPAIADAMLAINRPCLDMYHELVRGTGAEELVQDCYYLHVSRNPEAVDINSLGWKMRLERDVPIQPLKGGEIQEVEPEISTRFKSAMLIKQQGRALNPGRLGKVLAGKAESQGAKFVFADVGGIVPVPDGGYRIETSDGEHHAKRLVVAAGAWSARLLSPLGLRVVLEAERGYHLIFKNPSVSLKNSVMDVDSKVVTSSMEMGVRTAGTAEFAGLEAGPDYRRAEVFVKQSKELIPNLNTDDTEEWMGKRPSSPDSVPFIGEADAFPGLFYAFGHGHVGLTGAPMTGKVIAGLVAGEPHIIDMKPYRIERF